jgi:parvulin-like peptidyl-prolyl isomerase
MVLGSVSQPVQTEFGWHLVKVNDDAGVVEEIVRQVKIQEYFERVLAETREKLYVDIRFQ